MAKRLDRAQSLLILGLLGIVFGHSPIWAQTQNPDGPAKASSLVFEVASVKPYAFAKGQFAFATASRESSIQISGNRVTTQGLLAGLVLTAYKLRTFQVSGAPEWRNETGRHQIHVIEAKAPGDKPPTMDEARQMLQTLLTERFQLKFHCETKELPAYHLVVARDQAKLKPSAPDVESKKVSVGRLRTNYTNVSISELVLQMGLQFDRPLFDKTGLQGGYDFTLEYMPMPLTTVNLTPDEADELNNLYPADGALPLPVALQQQLGLKVVPTREQVEILVIDHFEKPSPN